MTHTPYTITCGDSEVSTGLFRAELDSDHYTCEVETCISRATCEVGGYNADPDGGNFSEYLCDEHAAEWEKRHDVD